MLNSVEAGSVGAEVDTTALKIQLRYPVSLKAFNDMTIYRAPLSYVTCEIDESNICCFGRESLYISSQSARMNYAHNQICP
jgi:hypothetical protein